MGRDLVVADGERLDCDVSVVGGNLLIEPEGTITGDVGIFSGNADIKGTVEGDIAVAWGNAEVAGAVEGDVFVSGDLSLLSGAEVSGQATVFGQIEKAEGATVEGGEWTLRNIGGNGRSQTGGAANLLMPLVFALVTVGLAALFAALAVGVIPGTVALTRDTAGTVGGALLSIFMGSVALFAMPILLIVTLITVIGPLVVLAVYAVGIALGSVGAGEVIGRRLVPRRGRPTRAAIGTGGIAAAFAIPMYFGTEIGLGGLYCGLALLAWCTVSWALGASIRALVARRSGSAGEARSESEPLLHSRPQSQTERANPGQGRALSGSEARSDSTLPAEIPDDVVERADELERSIVADARRIADGDGSYRGIEFGEAGFDPEDDMEAGEDSQSDDEMEVIEALRSEDRTYADVDEDIVSEEDFDSEEGLDNEAVLRSHDGMEGEEHSRFGDGMKSDEDIRFDPHPLPIDVPVSTPANLLDLSGMTPIYVALLSGKGITSLETLGRSTVDEIETALSMPGIRPVASHLIREWIDTARRAR